MKWINPNSPETRTYLKFVALCLLFIIGLGAMAGGIPMIIDGTGEAVGLSTQALVHAPFETYRVPGILLVVLNGIGSLVAFVVLYNNWRYHSYTVRGSGFVLLMWILVQVVMLRVINPLHILFAMIGIVLMAIGNYLKRFE